MSLKSTLHVPNAIVLHGAAPETSQVVALKVGTMHYAAPIQVSTDHGQNQDAFEAPGIVLACRVFSSLKL